MEKWHRCTTYLCLSLLLTLVYETSGFCSKIPEGVVKPRNRNGGQYMIEIPGNPKTYTPKQKYKIFLKIDPKANSQRAFKNFILTLESDDGENGHSLGDFSFDHDTEMLARMSSTCPNTLIESSTVAKTEIEVYWTAPSSGSGCVNIKASVVESRENWYSEDENLSKRLCEESLNENIQPDILEKCCACDEAKYEVAFEGKWTRNTHPRHFPMNQWETKFSDLIGASHQLDHAFWKYEDTASDGLKELAEFGNTKTLESELKNNSQHIRTIIKARGLQYPNITKTTYAVFRVDKKNHLVSLVAKITPSPDWIVGVSNLELCKYDCTWEESRTLNLYPWDVGTNDGLQYDSSNPSMSLQPIRRITPNNPNDPRSPFYTEDGEDIKPIAKLYLTRQRLYIKSCELENDDATDCTRSEWSRWTSCSASCGKGIKIRQRASMDEEMATHCGLNFLEHKTCLVQECSVTDNTSDEEIVTTESTAICSNEDEKCEEDENCPGSFWGDWTPCNVTCGKGSRTRMRMQKKNNETDDSNCKAIEVEDCEGDCDIEASTTNNVYAGMESSNIVIQAPVGEVINCKVSKWSLWSDCILPQSNTCGTGTKLKTREIKIHKANGGKDCPKKLYMTKICHVPCPELEECEMGGWSSWTPCSSNCGADAVQIRTRNILFKPSKVDECPPRIETKQCHLPVACTEDGKPILNR